MKKVLLAVGLLFALPVLAEKWQTLIEVKESKTLIDLDSVIYRDNMVHGNLRQVHYDPTPMQENLSFVFSCNERRGAITEYAAFEKVETGQTKLKEFVQRPILLPEQYEKIIPNTYGDAVMSFACTIESMKRQAIARLPVRK